MQLNLWELLQNLEITALALRYKLLFLVRLHQIHVKLCNVIIPVGTPTVYYKFLNNHC